MHEIDNNTKNVGLGYVVGTNNMVLPFNVNSLNGKLRIEIVPRAIGTGLRSGNLSIDGNTKNVGGAITNDNSETITNLTCDEVVGFPCLRVELI